MNRQAITPLVATIVGLTAAQVTAKATEIVQATGPSRHALLVSAGPATVTIAPGSARRNSITLPALDYVFSLDARCADSFTPETVALTIADSRTFLQPAERDEDSDVHEMPLTVPADQLAPLIVNDFCPASSDTAIEQASTESSVLTVSATLSATASLLCVAGNRREMIYTTTPLDVMLICAPADAAETED